MNKQKTLTIRTYEAPDTSAMLITQEHCFVATTGQKTLNDMDVNELYDEDF